MSSISATALLAFRQLDGNGNGALTKAELKKGAAFLPSAVRQAIKANGAANTLASMDADGNGTLSKTELSDGLAALTSSSAASVLLKAQESQSQLSQMLVGLKSGAYSSLVNVNTDSTTTAMQSVLTAYASGGKI